MFQKRLDFLQAKQWFSRCFLRPCISALSVLFIPCNLSRRSTGRVHWACGGRPRTVLIVPAAGPCRGRGAGLAPHRTRSGPRDAVVPGGSLQLRSWAACAVVIGCVLTRSLTRSVPRTVRRSTGDSAGASGLFCVDADPSFFASEDATPGSRACVRVPILLGRIGRAVLQGAFWCASPFLWPFCPAALLGPLRAGVALVVFFLCVPLCCFFFCSSLPAPPLSPAFCALRPWVPFALALSCSSAPPPPPRPPVFSLLFFCLLPPLVPLPPCPLPLLCFFVFVFLLVFFLGGGRFSCSFAFPWGLPPPLLCVLWCCCCAVFLLLLARWGVSPWSPLFASSFGRASLPPLVCSLLVPPLPPPPLPLFLVLCGCLCALVLLCPVCAPSCLRPPWLCSVLLRVRVLLRLLAVHRGVLRCPGVVRCVMCFAGRRFWCFVVWCAVLPLSWCVRCCVALCRHACRLGSSVGVSSYCGVVPRCVVFLAVVLCRGASRRVAWCYRAPCCFCCCALSCVLFLGASVSCGLFRVVHGAFLCCAVLCWCCGALLFGLLPCCAVVDRIVSAGVVRGPVAPCCLLRCCVVCGAVVCFCALWCVLFGCVVSGCVASSGVPLCGAAPCWLCCAVRPCPPPSPPTAALLGWLCSASCRVLLRPPALRCCAALRRCSRFLLPVLVCAVAFAWCRGVLLFAVLFRFAFHGVVLLLCGVVCLGVVVWFAVFFCAVLVLWFLAVWCAAVLCYRWLLRFCWCLAVSCCAVLCGSGLRACGAVVCCCALWRFLCGCVVSECALSSGVLQCRAALCAFCRPVPPCPPPPPAAALVVWLCPASCHVLPCPAVRVVPCCAALVLSFLLFFLVCAVDVAWCCGALL